MADVDSSNDSTGIPRRPEYMLTTYDNPFDPFTNWDEWFTWDEAAGYHSSGLLNRIARLSDELSEIDQHVIIQLAIDEIVRENVSGMHRKVLKGDVSRLQAQHEQDVQRVKQ